MLQCLRLYANAGDAVAGRRYRKLMATLEDVSSGGQFGRNELNER